MQKDTYLHTMQHRFRGFLPVIVDVETAGLNPATDALLEIAVVTLKMDSNGWLTPKDTTAFHIEPFDGANLSKEALEFNKIDPYHPFRFPVKEQDALTKIFTLLEKELKEQRCKRAVLVGHNSWFDLHFIQAATNRCGFKKSPFHAFTSLDTATLSAVCYGHTVLSTSANLAKIQFDANEAHSAIYDAQKTAELFCKIINKWQEKGGWPL